MMLGRLAELLRIHWVHQLYWKCLHWYEQFLQAVNDWVLYHWDHSTVIRCVCMLSFLWHFTRQLLYYCNMVEWSWWDWNLIWTTIFILQCYDTVGWVIWPVKLLLTAKRLAWRPSPKWLITYKLCSTSLWQMSHSNIHIYVYIQHVNGT